MPSVLQENPVYVTGVAESPLGEVSGHSELSMCAVATMDATREAGVEIADIDGIFTNYMGDQGSVRVAEYLGVQPRYCDSTNIGGASFEAHVHHAMLAIATGRCEVALVTYASRQRSRRARSISTGTEDGELIAQFEAPYGLPSPIGYYAMAAARHMHEFGTTAEQLAEVAVAARRWAHLNPKAWDREPLTVEDCLASRPIVEPLRRRDICLVTDGGGALVLTSAARARDAEAAPVRVLGAGESHDHHGLTQWRDLTTSAGVRSAREALSMAGIAPSDVDVFEPYDAFTSSVIVALEDVGFCEKGGGGAFVEDGRLAPGGSLPSMTSGGGLSYCHPGALGLLLLVEAVRQLRHEAGDRQVPDAEVALCHGVGGAFAASSTVVLARE
jgi:acetyl-CoA acetyltransferase